MQASFADSEQENMAWEDKETTDKESLYDASEYDRTAPKLIRRRIYVPLTRYHSQGDRRISGAPQTDLASCGSSVLGTVFDLAPYAGPHWAARVCFSSIAVGTAVHKWHVRL